MKREKNNRWRFVFFAFIVAGFLLFIKNSSASSGFFGGVFHPFKNAILRMADGISDLIFSITNQSELKEENERLIFQNRSLKSILNDFKELKSENESLRQAMKLSDKEKFNFILADVVSRSPLNFSQNFTINAGEKQQVKKGEAVIWGGRSLVGEIKEVSSEFSVVRTVNDSEFRSAVFIGEKRIEAIWKGSGLDPVKIDLIPIQAEIKEGDAIITSGLDKKFPRGIFIGEIKKAEKIEGKVFWDAEAEPAFRWDQLEQVLLLK